ncbi:MAG: adenylosuccinate synthase [Bacteroidia bacterium]|nr:adenylosuccinate synthase [Bacteroidia bacterium]
MKLDVILGLQWGDEGKGKIVDVLAPEYDVIARFQGGPNAGHSLSFGDVRHVLHNIPSGVFHRNIINIIGNGVIIDPVIFMKECETLVKMGIEPVKSIFISRKAHLILPSHRMMDCVQEQSKGISKIGSTLKGIGPTYTDKVSRNGLRAGDIFSDDFQDKFAELTSKHLQCFAERPENWNETEENLKWMKGIEYLKNFRFINSEYIINQYLREGKTILAEGAQGTMLDIDFGSYPFVTSSNTICAGAYTGLGVAPGLAGKTFGVFKAYCTRVGSGPFPTEISGKTGELIQKLGGEFGATTGRPRRCGWLDLVALKYAVMINGVTGLVMTKADVLDDFDEIQVAVAYKQHGQILDYVPFGYDNSIEPVYKSFKGWKSDITGCTRQDQLPAGLKEYIRFLEDESGVPVIIVSVGQDRKQTVDLR